MLIERLNEYDLTTDLEAEIAALLDASFAMDFCGRSYNQQRHHVRFMARMDGVLVGHMALSYRDIELGGERVPIWGLGEVCTVPEKRGQGVASQLLDAAIAFVRATSAQFLLLFGDRRIYSGSGFVTHDNEIAFTNIKTGQTGVATRGTYGPLMVLAVGDMVWDGTAAFDLMGHKF